MTDILNITSKDSSDRINRRSLIASSEKYYCVHYVQDLSQFVLGIGGGYTSNQYPYPVKLIEASGDHLTVGEINSPVPIHVKVGTASNPWIRVKQGDVIERQFSKVWVTTLDSAFAFVGTVPIYAEAIMYVSTGPFLTRRSFDEFDFARGFQTRQVVLAPATMTDLLALGGLPVFTTGKQSGIVRIQNTGANPVDIGYFTAGGNVFTPVNAGWTIPVAAIPYYTDFRFRHHINSPFYRLGAKSTAGTSIQVCIGSLEEDLTAPDGFQTGANGFIDLTP